MGMSYFQLYYSYEEILELLTPEECGEVIMALFAYCRERKLPDFDGTRKMAFRVIRAQIDRDEEAYKKRCDRNAENGKKGGRPPKANGLSENPKNRTVFSKTQKSQGEGEGEGKEERKGERKEKGKQEGEGERTSFCAEPETVSTPPAITILTNTGEEYPIYQNDIDRWSEQFPAVDVMQALRSMQAWSDSHPQKRKTKRGMRAFVTNWLNREQNKGGNQQNQKGGSTSGKSYDDDYEARLAYFQQFEGTVL